MLHNLLYPLSDTIGFLNLFKYLTFRTGSAMMTALVISFVIGPPMIRLFKHIQKDGQPIRDDGPKRHLEMKTGTPTMGGVIILASLLISTFLWADLSNTYVWLILFTAVSYGALGFWDDFLKLKRKTSKGVRSRHKFLLQLGLGFLIVGIVYTISPEGLQGKLAIPFLKDVLLDFGLFFLVFGALVVVGTSNAVNLTDGLDGLAIVPIMIAIASFGLIAYLVGNNVFASYLQLHHVPGSGELAIFCGSLIGAGLGFLWYNAPPAQIFMGDTGSLSAGASLGTLAVITRHEIILAVIGGLFVLETLSVIIQVTSFKLTGKRVFRMAPIHHHFEQKGWSEATIVIRFWIIAVILALAGLASLKLR